MNKKLFAFICFIVFLFLISNKTEQNQTEPSTGQVKKSTLEIRNKNAKLSLYR